MAEEEPTKDKAHSTVVVKNSANNDDNIKSCSDSDDEDEDYPDWVRSIRSSTGLETGIEIDFPVPADNNNGNGSSSGIQLRLSTCMEPMDIAPMFDGTQWAGTRVWRSSIVAIQYIVKTFGTTSTRPKVLLELGCGLGVPGMILHALLGWKVILTDKDPLPKQLQRNCQTNFFPALEAGMIQAHELDWSREGVRNLLQLLNTTTETTFDIVLNCDCVYEPLYGLSWKLLVETMDELLRINPHTIVLTCLERRKADGVDQFLEALTKSTTHVAKVERLHFDGNKYPHHVQLYRIRGILPKTDTTATTG